MVKEVTLEVTLLWLKSVTLEVTLLWLKVKEVWSVSHSSLPL